MAILFILIGAATFSPSTIVLEYRLDHYVQGLITSLRLARSKALHQVETVSLCPSKDGIVCTKEQYELGWILFHDYQLPRGQREPAKEALIWQQSMCGIKSDIKRSRCSVTTLQFGFKEP